MRKVEAEDVRAQMPTAGSDSSPSHLSPGSHQTGDSVDEQRFQSECDRRLNGHEQMSQELSKAKRKASRLEKEVEQLKKALREKTLALDMTERELQQARGLTKEWQALHLQRDQERKDAIKKAEGLQEQLAQLQSENLALRQQREDVRNKSVQERTRAVVQRHVELADAFKKQSAAETALEAATRQCASLQKENSRLQEDLDKTKAKMREVSAQRELESQKSRQIEAANRKLPRLVAPLPHRLVTPGAGHTPTAPYGKESEQRAQEDVREKHYLSLRSQAQEAARAEIEEVNTTSASGIKLLEQRITTLESELERERSMREEDMQLVREEMESSKKCYLVVMEMRRCLIKTLQKADEMLAEARATSPPEQRRRLFRRKARSLSRTRGQSGHPSGSAVDECETGSAGDSP